MGCAPLPVLPEVDKVGSVGSGDCPGEFHQDMGKARKYQSGAVVQILPLYHRLP